MPSKLSIQIKQLVNKSRILKIYAHNKCINLHWRILLVRRDSDRVNISAYKKILT